jgi:pimeloyl-ACP methyl ester carboxylesterase
MTDVRQAEFGRAHVAYRAAGAGDAAIVFIHGYASDGSVWAHQLSGTFAGRRLVAVDLAGHGQSDAPDTVYSMDYLAASVAAVLDHLRIGRAVVVGWSNGVPVARQFYRRYPERTEALVAVDGPLVQVMSREFGEQMLAPLKRPDYLDTLRRMTQQRPPGLDGLPDAFWDRMAATQLHTPQHVLVGTAEAMLAPEIWNTDPIQVPVLAVYAKSPMWPPDYEQRIRTVASQLEYHVWEGATHFLVVERAGAFNELLQRFIEALPRREPMDGMRAG